MRKRWRTMDRVLAAILAVAYWLFWAVPLSVANHKSCRPQPECWEQGETVYWSMLLGATILFSLLAWAFVAWARKRRIDR